MERHSPELFTAAVSALGYSPPRAPRRSRRPVIRIVSAVAAHRPIRLRSSDLFLYSAVLLESPCLICMRH